MRIACVRLPDEPTAERVCRGQTLLRLSRTDCDAVLLNQLPFGPRRPANHAFSQEDARALIEVHDAGLASLAQLLPGKYVLATRPRTCNPTLLNEAGVLHVGRWTALHRKSQLPQQQGWFEQSWFEAEPARPGVFDLAGVRCAFLACTELMFTEYARDLRGEGVEVLLAPRATGGSLDHWLTAGRMAAIWTGSYVLSSNRIGGANGFDGHGFAIAPDGSVIGVTEARSPVLGVEVDRREVRRNRRRYPCTLKAAPRALSESLVISPDETIA